MSLGQSYTTPSPKTGVVRCCRCGSSVMFQAFTCGRWTHCVSLFRRNLVETATQNQVVSLRSQCHSHFPSEQNKGEEISVLWTQWYKVNSSNSLLEASKRTFSRQSNRNLYGSIPYVAAEPNHGIKWNTTGGNDGSFGRS
jgi:hypothetical protein